MVAPGSLSAYFRMKAMSKEKEVRDKGKVELLREMDSSQMGSSSQANRLEHDAEDGYENDINSSDFVSEEDMDNEIEMDREMLERPNEAHTNQSAETPPKVKWTRGPTMCKDVLEWTFEEHRPIILNELGKPIGPDSKTLDKFSRFLGTIARSPTLAPLNNLNWHEVRDKDNIWNYVKTKFVISEEGGNMYVVGAVGRLWRRHKCIIKNKHFSAYDNDNDRLEHAPEYIPEQHFKELLEYWNLDIVQESSINQKDRHTMGPKSFARKEHELKEQDKDKKRPSQAKLYQDSRKRKAGKTYKTSYELIQSNIDKTKEVQMQKQIDGDQAYSVIMNPDNSKNQRQLGKCSKKWGESKRASIGGVIIPDEFLKPYKDQIVRDTVAEVMKMFKDQLPPETFANMTRSLGDMSSGLDVTGDPYKDTNDEDQDQGNDHLLE
ncbi:putative cobyric acid synthase [Bienertia sinuspersici]